MPLRYKPWVCHPASSKYIEDPVPTTQTYRLPPRQYNCNPFQEGWLFCNVSTIMSGMPSQFAAYSCNKPCSLPHSNQSLVIALIFPLCSSGTGSSPVIDFNAHNQCPGSFFI